MGALLKYVGISSRCLGHTPSHKGRQRWRPVSFHGLPGLPEPASVNKKGPVTCFQKGDSFLSLEHHFIILFHLIKTVSSCAALASALLDPALDGLPWGWVSNTKVIFCFCVVVAARRSQEPRVGLISIRLVPGGPEGSIPTVPWLLQFVLLLLPAALERPLEACVSSEQLPQGKEGDFPWSS